MVTRNSTDGSIASRIGATGSDGVSEQRQGIAPAEHGAPGQDIPVDGGESEALLVDDPILTYAILDGGIYSLINAGDSYEIVLTKADGSSRITIYSQPEPIDAFNVSENHLYLLASFENDALNVLTIWNMETNTIEQTMDDLIQPVVWCFDSDIVYLLSDGLVRFNPNSGERVVFDN